MSRNEIIAHAVILFALLGTVWTIIAFSDDQPVGINWSMKLRAGTASSSVIVIEMPKVEWLASSALMVMSVQDPYCHTPQYRADVEVGLRADGVLVWRRVKP